MDITNENNSNELEKRIQNQDISNLFSNIYSSYNKPEIDSLFTQLIMPPDPNSRPDPLNKKDPTQAEYRKIAKTTLVLSKCLYLLEHNILIFPSFDKNVNEIRLYSLRMEGKDIKVADEYIVCLEYSKFQKDIRVVYQEPEITSKSKEIGLKEDEIKKDDINKINMFRGRKIVSSESLEEQKLLIFFLLKKRVMSTITTPESFWFFTYKSIEQVKSLSFSQFLVIDANDLEELFEKNLQRYQETTAFLKENNEFEKNQQVVDYMPNELLDFSKSDSFLNVKKRLEDFLKQYRSKGID